MLGTVRLPLQGETGNLCYTMMQEAEKLLEQIWSTEEESHNTYKPLFFYVVVSWGDLKCPEIVQGIAFHLSLTPANSSMLHLHFFITHSSFSNLLHLYFPSPNSLELLTVRFSDQTTGIIDATDCSFFISLSSLSFRDCHLTGSTDSARKSKIEESVQKTFMICHVLTLPQGEIRGRMAQGTKTTNNVNLVKLILLPAWEWGWSRLKLTRS